MQIWEMAMCVEKAKCAPIVFLSLEGKAREAVLELDIAAPNFEDGMEKVYKKLDTLFLEDINQSPFSAYKTFKGYQRQPDTSIEDFLINFGQHVTKLKDFNILLLEPVVAFRALKSANLTLENGRLVKATIGKLTLSSMSGQLRKIIHKQSSDVSFPNTPPIMLKNEIDVIAYMENNQTDPSEVYYGRSSDQRDSRFNGWQGKINHGGRRHNNNKTRSTDKKTKINPLGPEGNNTVYFKCCCKFHWSYDCPYTEDTKDKHEDSRNGNYLSLSNIIMMSQLIKREVNGNNFLGETLGSTVLNSGASGTVCRTKWYKCFLEILTNAQEKKKC